MTRRICNAIMGFTIGIFTIPLAAIAWPFVAAWWLWNETDDGDGNLVKETEH